MPTIIDELVVQLGLDPKKFNEGSRDAMESFKKTKEGAETFSKSIEQQGAHLSDVFGMVRKGVLGIGAAFVGGEAASFINNVVNMDAATGRMAKTIGTSVENLSTWQYMIKQVGGEAASATSALSSLQQAVEESVQGGTPLDGGLMSLMNQSGAGRTDSADVILRKIQTFISGEVGSGRMTAPQAATMLRRVPGMNQDLINLLLGDFKKIEDAVRAMGGATGDGAKQAQELQRQTVALTSSLDNLARLTFPGLTVIVDTVTKAIGQDIKDVKAFLGLFGVGSASASTAPGMGDARERLAKGLTDRASGGASSASAAAIAAGESAGSGGYSAVGPVTRSGDRAYGKYQVMGQNIPQWTKEALGRSMTPQEFLADHDAQEAVFRQKFGALEKKYGPQGAAAAWFAGEGGMKDGSRKDSLGTSVDSYVSKFNRNLGAGAAAQGRKGAAGNTSTSTSETNIGKIEVNAPNATDADGIAGEIGNAMKRQSLLAPVNTGLV